MAEPKGGEGVTRNEKDNPFWATNEGVDVQAVEGML